ncbi:MAG TPA: hypothetical protein VHO90_19170 [Bacteroidales bacterium]|nr:hypothetical protein [Bacteroidales bacterium]
MIKHFLNTDYDITLKSKPPVETGGLHMPYKGFLLSENSFIERRLDIMSLVQPYAIFASVPPGPNATWIGTQPVNTYEFHYWPNIDWSQDIITPSSGYGEIPQHLWSDYLVQNPEVDETHTFMRRFTVVEAGSEDQFKSAFSGTTLPSTTALRQAINVKQDDNGLFLVISHTADNLFELQVLVNGIPIAPTGKTQISPDFWSIRTYLFLTGSLYVNDIIDIQSKVTNIGVPGSTPEANVAMFTWVMSIY